LQLLRLKNLANGVANGATVASAIRTVTVITTVDQIAPQIVIVTVNAIVIQIATVTEIAILT
jgi:hypothetical protein